MMILPLNNRVLLRIHAAAQKEVAGIIITTQKETTERGTILALPRTEKELQVGDDVIIKTGTGSNVPDGRLVSREEILGVYAE
jgi:co-chaperonin GroES (HSP10)